MAKPYKELGRYGGVGIELVLAILILGGAGHWLDERYWHGRGWGMAVGFVLGVAVGVRNLMRTAATMQRDIERAEAEDPAASRRTVDESWLHKADPPSTTDDPESDEPEHSKKNGHVS